MSTPLFTRLSLPDGLEELVEVLAREVMRNQYSDPSDIYNFAWKHFSEMVARRNALPGKDGAPYGGSRRRRISASSQGEAGSQRTSRRGPAGGGTVPTSVAGRKKEVKHLKEETLTKTGSLDRAANRPARRSIIADTKDKKKTCPWPPRVAA
nr:uncharacterized protein LOC128696409 [Cherax quadricarinatus]